jgi:hypothetical protein
MKKSYFSYSTIPIGSLAVVHVSWDVAGAPIYSVFYYIVLYTTFSQAVICPEVAPGEIYDDWVSPTSLFYYSLWGEVALAAIIAAVGWRKFGNVVAGDLRKRGLLLFTTSGIMDISILLDTVTFMEWAHNFLWFPRVAMIIGALFVYMGFKPPEVS